MALGGRAWAEVGLVGKMSRNKTPLECGLELGVGREWEQALGSPFVLLPWPLSCWDFEVRRSQGKGLSGFL